MSPRPSSRAAIAARYAGVTEPYRSIWGPTLLSFSRPVLGRVGERLPSGWHDVVVADIACGTGTVSDLLEAAGARTIRVDGTPAMLAGQPHAVAGEMTRLPLRDGCADVAVSSFALQHTPRTGVVFREFARLLRPGGHVVTITWGSDHGETGGPYAVLEQALDYAGAAKPEPVRTWHDRVDAPRKVARFARAAGLEIVEAESSRLPHRWTRESFLAWFTSGGHTGRRLAQLDATARARAIAEVEAGLRALPDDALIWTAEIVTLIARRP